MKIHYNMISKLIFLLLTFSALGWASAAPEKKVIDGVTYHILETKADLVKIVWKDKEGKQLGSFPAVTKYLSGEGAVVTTLMNGGIFEPGRIPSGLLIQDGKELTPVNRRKGKGNFFLKPNGIFLIGSKGATVINTDEYPLKDVKVDQAVQSGPLLLRSGKTHPQFNKGSKSRLHRNGVGVTKEGKVVFAITDFDSPKFPNLFEFAQLFRTLGCDDALFLDGDLSDMVSGKEITKPSNHYGSIIAVVAEAKKTEETE